tara:strand:- start:952 stop:1821 length:870 start_codon:yes stop_codon:yes gene_type:complete
MMKHYKKYIIPFFAFFLLLGCTEKDNTVDKVFQDTVYGAILRTTQTISTSYNAFDPSSLFSIMLEEQDEEMGNLLASVDVYISFEDNQEDAMDKSVSEVLLVNIPASDFTTGDNGLPVIQFERSLAEAASAVGISDSDYSGGDRFIYRMVLNLTDGRSYTNTDYGGTVSNSSFFRSPLIYYVGVNCTPITPIPGTYSIDLQDSYGDGWNGASIVVTIDGVAESYTLDSGSSGSFSISVPEDTEELSFVFNSGDWDGEVTFQIYAPNGEIASEQGPSPGVGEIPLSICPD